MEEKEEIKYETVAEIPPRKNAVINKKAFFILNVIKNVQATIPKGKKILRFEFDDSKECNKFCSIIRSYVSRKSITVKRVSCRRRYLYINCLME